MHLDLFQPISLADLNAKAQMMTRLDNKYVVPIDAFTALMPEFAAAFDVLEIDGQRSFGYRTCYFDSPEMCSFRHHVQGRRIRSKVRVRHYLDAGLCFLEVKLKTARKITVKKRQSHDPGNLESLCDTALAFVDTCHMAQYRRRLVNEYAPFIKMQYDRVTLVARSGGERITIDRGLQFWNDTAAAEIAQDVIIIETKSRFGRGISDRILRRAGHHPIGSCSKYCVGLAAVGHVPKFNKFLPAYRRLINGAAPKQVAARAGGTDGPETNTEAPPVQIVA